MKSLTDCIRESLLNEAKFNVIADEEPETKQKDYIKVCAMDENDELIDEIGYIALIEIEKIAPLKEYKKWVPELGKFFKKNHGLRGSDWVSIQFYNEDDEDYAQFTGSDGNGKIQFWDLSYLDKNNPFK